MTPIALAYNSHTNLTFFALVSKKFVSLQPNINPKYLKKMAKIYGLFGAMTGKLADTVMSVRNGEQIARKYQPVVYNPSTEAQIETRAKFKALSQLSAVLGPVIPIRRNGMVSARNIFTSKNFPNVTFAEDTATVNLSAVQLTASNVALPSITATRDAEDDTTINTLITAPGDYDAVMYIAVTKNADGKLNVAGSVLSTVRETPGVGYFVGELATNSHEEAFVYAYGIRYNSDHSRVVFGNLTSASAATVATLLASSALVESDVTLSETQCVHLNVAE